MWAASLMVLMLFLRETTYGALQGTLAFTGLGATALATSLVTLRRRLQLSKAKHRSLVGHARIARRATSFR